MLRILKTNKRDEILTKIIHRGVLPTKEVEKTVREIIEHVKEAGNEAVFQYTKQFDGVAVENTLVTEQEYEQAFANTSPQLMEALKGAKANIEAYHQNQYQQGFTLDKEDSVLRQLITPIERVGVYVPGGKAAYPSTVLMNVIPAVIAGVREIIMITPPNKDGKIKDSILVAAKLAGVTSVYKMGGAQGIAALAYGTETIHHVDKIVGPGNMYVAMAKKLVSGDVGIDMIAGPTEVVIIADDTANPIYVAADLLAQAEHDEMASSVVVTDSSLLAEKIVVEVERLLSEMPRKDIIEKALENYGAVIVTNDLEEALLVVNQMAPEHVEIMTRDPFKVYPRIKHAGAIFLGDYTPESVGDYYAGTNHTLPTNRTARFSSPLNVNDFQKKTSVVYYSKEALQKARAHIEQLAQEEELYAHGHAVSVRFKGDEK
ncbi:MAG: histidinol dehydrogenase [Bacillaceae bacterium]